MAGEKELIGAAKIRAKCRSEKLFAIIFNPF
jgi:hypothetical protein